MEEDPDEPTIRSQVPLGFIGCDLYYRRLKLLQRNRREEYSIR